MTSADRFRHHPEWTVWLAVRATEEAVALAVAEEPTAKRRPRKSTPTGVEDIAGRLSDAFETKVKIQIGRAKGRIVVEFGSVDDLQRTEPSSARAAQMFAEIERLEAAHRREQAVEQGVRQVESFIEKGDLPKAELALKILVQMDPENRHRKRLEKQVRALPR